MKTKCCNCGSPIDTENEEFLTTASGPLCINCANEESQSVNADSSEVNQTYL